MSNISSNISNITKTKPVKLFMSRVIFVAICLLIQAFWVYSTLVKLINYYWFISAGISAISILLVLWILGARDNPSYKLIWTIVILSAPIFGVILYLFCGRSKLTKKVRYDYDGIHNELTPMLNQDDEVMERLRMENRAVANICSYIQNYGGYPVYDDTETEYLATGEAAFEALKRELLKAEHYIFMEYFIIQDGDMWSEILEILENKVKEGVEVRVMYDDMGCVALHPRGFKEKIKEKGIKCRAFNPFIPLLSVIMNHRDHRKIAVIDGYVGFTGGFNLADEYINVINPYGQWKDAGLMLKGEGVRSMTAMFLEMWNALSREDESFDIYGPKVYHQDGFLDDGFVQPFGDSPLDDEGVSENLYLNMIHQAKRYVYIYTPYLIIDNEMMTALCLAAKSNVDVRIVTPHIPDKKIIFLLTRSYYSQLIDAGVKIIEYEPGFIHSKCVLCDDEFACVGTINLDYRSLYLHFENGVFLYKTKSLVELKKDFAETFSVGVEITKEFCDSRPIAARMFQSILRVAAPLL